MGIDWSLASQTIRRRSPVKTVLWKKRNIGLPRSMYLFEKGNEFDLCRDGEYGAESASFSGYTVLAPRLVLSWLKWLWQKKDHNACSFFLPSSLLSISLSLLPRCSGPPDGPPSMSWTLMPLRPLGSNEFPLLDWFGGGVRPSSWFGP